MSQTNGRQSFSHRICDDLSEEILQYLSVDDKLRLECVFKQFQRTVFEKQFDLYIGDDPQKRVKSLQGILFEGHGCLDWMAFQTLLKKFPNIQSIVFGYHFGRNQRLTFRRIIALFTKYCNHLKRLDYYCSQIDDKVLNEFIEKFGSKIVSIKSSRNQHNEHLKCLSNLEELSICRLRDNIHHLLEIESKKLRKLCIQRAYDVSEKSFLSILSHFQKFQLISFELYYCPDQDQSHPNIVLNEISKFQHLIHLKFHQDYENQQLLSDSWNKIFQNCTQLKSFGTDLVIKSEDCSEIREMITNLKEIKRLKRLELYLWKQMDDNLNPNVNNWFTSEEWKQLSNISHLILHFQSFRPFDENFVTEIDKTLPKLQYLSISKVFETEPNVSIKMADILGGLSRLESIKLFVSNEFICNQIKAKVIQNCRKIRVIDIRVLNE